MPWDPAFGDSQILAIHAALLPTGQILLFGGDEHSQAQHTANSIDHSRLYDPATGVLSPIPSPTTDVFCAGEAFLPDGRLLVGGGTETWGGEAGEHGHGAAGHFTGHRASWVYRPRARSWTRVADMRPQPGKEASNEGGGRWYPTLLTLTDGQVLAIAGHPSRTDSRHGNTTPERYAAAANAWSLLPAQDVNGPWYPRVHVLRDGTVFFVSMADGFNRRYDPTRGTYVGATIQPPGDLIYTDGWDATSVLLPLLPGDGYAPRILACGGVQPLRINLGESTPTWQPTGPRQGAAAGRIRRHLCPVILPTGQVFLSGGVTVSDPENPVREAEIYSPAIDWAAGTYSGAESWTTAEAAQVTRNYHSVALLMPNGRVWTAGSSIRAQQGDPSTVGEKRIEIYRPAYDGAVGRPQITAAPVEVAYRETFEVRTPQAATIRRVALIRAGSITHAFDSDMRYVAASFTHAGGDRLTVTAPPHGGVAPPGHYMLWVVDANGLPCTQASFVRIGAQGCFVVTDRSTFSIHEVNALLAAGAPAVFPRALYVVMDGFLPHELGSPMVAPTLGFTFDSPSGAAVSGMSAALRRVLLEDPAAPPDTAQRATFMYDVHLANASAYASFSEVRAVNVHATHGTHACDAVLRLTHQPNPYMVDGDVSWLSVDLRVFQIRPGSTRAGVTHGSGDGSPQPFLAQLLPALNAAPNDDHHPFLDITPDQMASGLELSREVNGQRVFNYAIAKVRYRAGAVPATDVKVFFRLFNSVGTALQYNPSTSYRRASAGAAAIPLLGLQGTTLASIPFFAAERVDTSTRSMTTQTDPLNRRTMNPAGAQESVAYFGVWLDFNQTTPRFPLNPVGDGPFANRLSIQELARAPHQCLVAEVFFPPDPIPFGATPSSNEDLSQRNLAIVQSSNPGNPATRTVEHTFELKPSGDAQAPGMLLMAAGVLADEEARFGRADELMITWGQVPPDARATIYMPDVEADEILRLAAGRDGPPVLERVDAHTIRCSIGDVSFVPIPGGRSANIPALITLELPAGVTKGQVYTVVVQQYSGLTGRVVGAFEIRIPISTGQLMLPEEIRLLSVLRHIALAIPKSDPWYPIFRRYLRRKEDRVEGLGGNPDDVHPNPDGTGNPVAPERSDDCRVRWLVPALVALIAVVIGTASTTVAAPVAAVGAILLLAAFCLWIFRCRPSRCDLLTGPILGLAAAAGVLGVVRLLGAGGPHLTTTLAVVAIVLTMLLIVSIVACCCGYGWCVPFLLRPPGRVPRAEPEPPTEPEPPPSPSPQFVEEPGVQERGPAPAHAPQERG